MKRFYALIIGSEILNRRRRDAHFEFVSSQLQKRGWEFWGCHIIKDDPALIVESIKQVAKDPEAVLFCFGGIGATPDDYTRQCAAEALDDGKLYEHAEAKERILRQFGEDAYPHRIKMAMLPKGAKLLDNVVNNVPGFQVDDRFFFTPGFPEMAHSMITQALEEFYPKNRQLHRYTLRAFTSENYLIDVMKRVPEHIDLSSLPKFVGDKRVAVISVASYEKSEARKYYELFTSYLRNNGIEYEEGSY